MECKYCRTKLDNIKISKFQLNRNKNFYCNRECYLKYIRREKIKNYNFFSKVDTEEKAYWLGFIYADGNIHSKNNCLNIGLSRRDIIHLKKFSSIFDVDLKEGSVVCNNKRFNNIYVSIYSKKLCDNLKKIGVLPRKSYLDNDYILNNIPDNLMNHFIRGYFDGDGSINFSIVKSGKNYSLSFAGVYSFLKSLSKIIVDATGVSSHKVEKGKGVFILRWGGLRQILMLNNFLYNNATVFLERKKNIFNLIEKDIKFNKESSIYRGVVWHKNNKKWLASISEDKKRINLGYYVDEVEAAKAYDLAVIKYNKPLYKLNFRIGD